MSDTEIKHYRYKNQIVTMDNTKLKIAFDDLEAKLRTVGEFAYSQVPKITQKQVIDIQKVWPAELVEEFKTQAKAEVEKAGAQKLNAETAYKAMMNVLMDKVLAKRTSSRATASPNDGIKANIQADVAVSAVFDCAPDVSADGGIRVIGGKKVDVRLLIKSNKVVVQCDQADADIFIYGIYNAQIGRVTLIGWAKQQDIRLAEKGNKLTDPVNCSWNQMAYWMSIANLRPMSTLLKESGVKELMSGIVLEKVPDTTELPLPSKNMDRMFTKGNSAERDFYTSLGLSDPPKKTEEPKQTGGFDL